MRGDRSGPSPAVSIVLGLAAAATAVGAGVWIGRRSVPASVAQGANAHMAEAAHRPPIATVEVAPLVRRPIEETVVAYGTVVAALGETHSFSAPLECLVMRVLVTPGQALVKGDPLVVITPSPTSRLELREAQNERDTARSALRLLRRRLALKLATRRDLLPAAQRLRVARLRVRSLKERGYGQTRTLRAEAPGMVSDVDVQQGALVPEGTRLVATIGRDQITVRLGLENEDIGHVKIGQRVHLVPVNAPAGEETDGEVAIITHGVNPKTRLVDVFVTPGPKIHLMLHAYVRGTIVVASHDALVAPTEAVLPFRGRHVLFTITGGKAARHIVDIGLEEPGRIEVLGGGLEPGAKIVVVGNAELRDGMAVRVEPTR